jgi:shikimate kinase
MSSAIDKPFTSVPLALVGFMGAGKSAVGRLVAARLSLPFVDCDTMIERRHGDIAEIFATHGEQVFRRLERDVVCAALAATVKRPSVISLGGGAVMSGDVREALQSLPHVIWLTAPAEVLWQRVRGHSLSSRPLAADEQSFRRRLEERSALYASVATATVANDGTATAAAIADAIALLVTDPPVPAGRCA